jgi:outer membrane immunogenic protein
MTLKVGLAAIVLMSSMSAVFAADLPARTYTKAPVVPMEPPCMWCGFYLGIQGGGAWGKESFTDNLGGVPDTTVKPSGGVFGGVAGFRYQISQFVFGGELTGSWADLNETVVKVAPISDTFKVRSLYTATGQAGIAFGPALLYGKAGWAGASTQLTGTNINGFGVNHQDVGGWTAGVGFDYAVWQNVVLGIEYDHFDLKYGGSTSPFSNGGAPLLITNTSRLTIDQVVGRLTYKFNWGGGPVVARY